LLQYIKHIIANVYTCTCVFIILQAHNDAVVGNYEKAKKEAWTVWIIFSVAVLIDVLIVVIVVAVKTT